MSLSGDDVVTVTMLGRMFQQRIMNVFTYTVDGPVTGNTTQADLNSFLGVWAGPPGTPSVRLDTYLDLLPNQYVLNHIRVQRVFAERSVMVERAIDLDGTYPGDAETANVAAVITRRTERAGRRMVSNTHIGGIPTLAQASGLLTEPYKVLMADFATQMIGLLTDPFNDLVFRPCIYHPTFEPNTDDLITFVIQPTVRVMRRRTVGVGE